jgi:hypothetical protein
MYEGFSSLDTVKIGINREDFVGGQFLGTKKKALIKWERFRRIFFK